MFVSKISYFYNAKQSLSTKHKWLETFKQMNIHANGFLSNEEQTHTRGKKSSEYNVSVASLNSKTHDFD